VEEYASKGLRTLVLGYKELENQKNLATITAAEVEVGLHLVGVTAVEDLLQENVAQCIEDFRDAGMKVWMLTGDKGATAKEIAYSCALLPKKQTTPAAADVVYVKFQGVLSFLNRLSSEDKINQICPPISSQIPPKTYEVPDTDVLEFLTHNLQLIEQQIKDQPFSLVISGNSMQLILNAEKDTVLSSFVKSILIKAQTVVMYRSTPLQKAEVVKMIRKNLKS